MFEDLPLFSSTVKILKFFGFIFDCNWRRYFCLLSCLTLNASQLANILITRQSLNGIVRDAYILVMWNSAFMRTILIIINRRRYERFMEELKDVYVDMEKNECDEIKQMLVKTCKFARKMAFTNMALGIISSIGLIIFPIFGSSRALPYGMYIPGVDKYQTPWYEALYAFQAIITSGGYCMYIPFTNLIVSFIMFGVLRCKVLQCHLKNLKNLYGKDIRCEVFWCIRYQMEIIRYVKDINSMTSFIFLVEFVASGALLCALLFLLNVVSTLGEFVIVCFYMSLILSQILSVYWFANELSVQSSNVAIAGYATNWYDFDLKTEKSIMMFIAQTQRRCEIMVGNMYPMTLQTFQSLLNKSYSYFTLLRRV